MGSEVRPMHAVLTGNVPGSARLPGGEQEHLRFVMQRAASQVQYIYPDHLILPVDIQRQDSWQAMVLNPEVALAVCLYFHASVRAGMKDVPVHLRCSIGLGNVDKYPEDRVGEGDGEAFWLSRHGLERMPRKRHLVIVLAAHYADCLSDASDSLLFLLDALSSRWTPRQAEAVAGAMAGMTQEAIAQHWQTGPITQQAVAQHLDRAGWHAIEHGLTFFERWLSLPRQLPFSSPGNGHVGSMNS